MMFPGTPELVVVENTYQYQKFSVDLELTNYPVYRLFSLLKYSSTYLDLKVKLSTYLDRP